MGISLRDLVGSDGRSPRQVARDRGVESPFAVSELITPLPTDDPAVPFVETTWSNWVDDCEQTAFESKPETKADLVEALYAQAELDDPVRAVGSGHSHSRVAEPREQFLDLERLSGTLSHEGWLKADADAAHLVRVKAGTVLKDLNRNVLKPRGLALHNMGSFDGQTVAGAVNTSTHGTGIGLSTVADAVRSVELVTVVESRSGAPLVRAFRIEPSDGITDRDAFEADVDEHGMALVQDDDVFYSAVVGYGTMGVAWAYTLETRDFYWLEETSRLERWNDLSRHLSPTNVRDFVGRSRHLQILVNLPIVQDGQMGSWAGEDVDLNDPVCLVRRHDVDHDPPEKPDGWSDPWPPERRTTPLRDAAQSLRSVHPFKPNESFGRTLHNNFFEPEANRDPFVGGRSSSAWYVALRRLRDDDPDRIPPEPPTSAISTEVAVPVEQVVPAVNAVFRTVRDETLTYDGERREIFYGAPMGIRFVAGSDHHLCPEFERPSATIEVPFPVEPVSAPLRPNVPALSKAEIRDRVAKPALHAIERLLVEEFDGRPHMGKTHTADASELEGLYPRFAAPPSESWTQTYRRFNPFGTFDNAFTDRLGISRRN